MFITYKFCGCSATIMAKLSAILKPECDKTLRVSALAEKTVKGYKDSTIKEPHLFCNHSSGFDDFSILAFNNYDFEIKTSIRYLWNFLMTEKHMFIYEKHMIPGD